MGGGKQRNGELHDRPDQQNCGHDKALWAGGRLCMPVWEQGLCSEVCVGARLARDEGHAVSGKPRRLYREQALLPQMGV